MLIKNKLDLTVTIVLYNETIENIKNSIDCFLKIKGLHKKLYLVDNSPYRNLYLSKINRKEIEYIFNAKNLGFSKAHNLIINKIENISEYHLILNSDVVFKSKVIEELMSQLNSEEELALITPKVKFPNGEHQYNIRKFPTFLDLIFRRLAVFKRRIYNQEYRNLDVSKPFYPEAIHGCFMLFKTNDFVQLKGFDERYFLYMEDIDICRKIDAIGKQKMYYPNVEITHQLQQGSSKKMKLFMYHLTSAIKYFLKWK